MRESIRIKLSYNINHFYIVKLSFFLKKPNYAIFLMQKFATSL
ncbi:hypothetical protein A1OE_1472 [Candidatus Endolissoclinum faulkneri L2]|uniref:Uncharacterized protein n=1 Tax=Candidatus Endolissoclinum faulkneri L2 TaxID=1193729 RepID=K7ZDL8_9PROT|nr:hypothetical protein A1OE_1472 [Candidatus Endolissoclinum faulkneri L2]